MNTKEEEGQLAGALARFGLNSLRLGQSEVIERVLLGESVLALMPTGAGKSLCYQVPACMLSGVILVVSPLLALMKEQAEYLASCGLSAFLWNSTLSVSEKEESMALLRTEASCLLFLAPESLGQREIKALLDERKPTLFVIDEVHCYSEWGQSFRPEYRSLAQQKEHWDCPVLALTATATEPVVEEICEDFGILPSHVVRLPLRKENIERFFVQTSSAEEKKKALLAWLSEQRHVPAIVYAHKREEVESLATFLQSQGYGAKAYHAGLVPEVKAVIQEDFMRDEIPILVATIAFGMGVDKSNIASVVHHELPASLEAYLQESGRAGRKGHEAYSLVLGGKEDMVALQNRWETEKPFARTIESFLRFLCPCPSDEWREYSAWEMQGLYDLSEVFIDRLLGRLEREGVMEWGESGQRNWQGRLQVPLSVLLAGASESEQAFWEWLVKEKKVTLEQVADKRGIGVEEAQLFLEDCEQSGEWVFKKNHKVRFYRQKKPLASYRAWAEETVEQTQAWRARGQERLWRVWDFFTVPFCLNQQLELYFGESPQAPCGHCSACASLMTSDLRQSEGQGALSEALKESQEQRGSFFSYLAELNLEDVAFMRELNVLESSVLARPEQKARFLAGFLSAPALRARLWKLPQYGAYKSYPISFLEDYL